MTILRYNISIGRSIHAVTMVGVKLAHNNCDSESEGMGSGDMFCVYASTGVHAQTQWDSQL